MEDIKIWAQMFFEDGSVSQGRRIPAQWLEDDYKEMIQHTANVLLESVHRIDGWLLLWGAGNMVFTPCSISSSSSQLSELDS